MQQAPQAGQRVTVAQPRWLDDTNTRKEAAKINPASVKRMTFTIQRMYYEGSPFAKADLPRLEFRDRESIQFVLTFLRQAKRHSFGGMLMNKIDNLVFYLKNGECPMFNFNIEAPEYTFGEDFYRRVPPFLAQKCAEQVRGAIARVRLQIVAVKSPSGRRWSQPEQLAAIVRELSQVDARFYNLYRVKNKPVDMRLVTVETKGKPVRLVFINPEPTLVGRFAWLR